MSNTPTTHEEWLELLESLCLDQTLTFDITGNQAVNFRVGQTGTFKMGDMVCEGWTVLSVEMREDGTGSVTFLKPATRATEPATR